MNKEDIDLLEENGWEVTCESPFELELIEDRSSTATGFGAHLILQYYKNENN